jgi:hypothetical protein
MAIRRLPRLQQGAALLIFMILLVMAGMTYLVSQLAPGKVEVRRNQQTNDAMTQARDALIGYALKYRDAEASQGRPDRMYGYLPLPDLGSSRNQNADPDCKDASNNPLEGCDANTPTGIGFDANGILPTVVGRLPWRTLGIPPLRDGNGECLWLMVSSLHARKQRSTPLPVLPPMNGDTLGQLDIVAANGTAALASALANAHDRPVAIIFSPGPPLPGQDRGPSATDDVSQCGGNYNAANYLDPVVATSLGGTTNYLSGTNAASGATGDSDTTNDPDTPKALLTQGKVFVSGSNFLPNACQGANCALEANDRGLPITSANLFGAIRKNNGFHQDINTLLDRIASCLSSEIAAGGVPTTYGKISGADDNACYGMGMPPIGYYPHYKEMIFFAKPASGASVTIDGVAQSGCAGALVYANQRGAGQQRITLADRSTYANYLEGNNLTSFTGAGNVFTGAGLLGPVKADKTNPQDVARCTAGGNWIVSPGCQTMDQDIVRCVPASPNMLQVASPVLDTLGGQLTSFEPTTGTLTLGRLFSIADADRNANAKAFFGCSWSPTTHLLGSGLRAYFKFRILDTGEGFSFAIVDSDRSATDACGAAAQHLAYSGNNTYTPPILFPKIGIEIDTKQTLAQQSAFNPLASNTLDNGRSDPNYTGGHFGIVYWGGEAAMFSATPTAGGACRSTCKPPRYCGAGNACYLPQEEDDNVHGLPTPPDTSLRPAPRNPPAPATPTQNTPTQHIGIYKLDPNLSQVPVNQDIHVRIELTRTATDTVARSKTYKLEVWLLKDSTTDANQIAAMKDTTRSIENLYPPHVSDIPKIYDIQGGACASGSICPSGQSCSASDNMCYADALKNVRTGFTVSQSTAASDQIITVSDFFTTWLP